MLVNVLLILLGIVVVVAIGLVIWIIRAQNKLVKADESCGNSLSQIGVQLSSRWDALTSLADLAKTYSRQEYETITDTIKARQGIDANSSVEEIDKQESLLEQGFGRVSLLVESYPQLKSNEHYLKTMEQVGTYEDNVRMSRMVYNDSVTLYNRLVRSVPGAWVARPLGFTIREYLEDDKSKAAMPSLER